MTSGMQRLQAFVAVTFMLASAACAHHPTTSQGSATPTPAAIETHVPVQSAIPAPIPSTPSPSPSPAPSPTLAATEVVTLPPNAPPRIVAVHLSKQTVHGGEAVTGTVVTTSNVASVEARIATFSISVPKVGVGRFALNYVVPNVPFFLHGTYPMTLIARNTAGEAVRRVIPITVE
jgi:hypothetical protein